MSSRFTLYSLIIFFVLFQLNMAGQGRPISISLHPVSTAEHDEFSPSFYKDGLVFCSSYKSHSMVYCAFTDSLTSYVTTLDACPLLAKELTTRLYDGPATFSSDGNTIYYARNNNINKHETSIFDKNNKIGLYTAQLVDGAWKDIRPFQYSDTSNSYGTPSLNYNSTRIYFASNKPGGYGGTDIYYCQWIDTSWGEPVNLGSNINTEGNESYPFACRSGHLFFTSEGQPGFGGKDIFVTKEYNGEWLVPEHLPAPINSELDDFSLICNPDFTEGYFSSTRNGTDDIFSFKSLSPQFFFCSEQYQNNYCFTFYDEKTNELFRNTYEWNFGNGIMKTGKSVEHCFPSEGEYTVTLKITNQLPDTATYTYSDFSFELRDSVQPYITHPFLIIDQQATFNAGKSKLPQIKNKQYFWDFGEGFNSSGMSCSNIFKSKGDKEVRLGVRGSLNAYGFHTKECVSKQIYVASDMFDLSKHHAIVNKSAPEFSSTFIEHYKKAEACYQYAIILSEFSPRQKYNIEKFIKTSLNNTVVPGQDTYPFIDELIKLMAVYSDMKIAINIHSSQAGLKEKNQQWSKDLSSNMQAYFNSKTSGQNNIQFNALGENYPLYINEGKKDALNRRIEVVFY